MKSPVPVVLAFTVVYDPNACSSSFVCHVSQRVGAEPITWSTVWERRAEAVWEERQDATIRLWARGALDVFIREAGLAHPF